MKPKVKVLSNIVKSSIDMPLIVINIVKFNMVWLGRMVLVWYSYHFALVVSIV